jgi:predicted RNA-binding Zn-ribbon protein involved in translation (DUF1610 family)
MASDTQSILCGACRVPIEGPTDGKGENVFACPSCGRSDTRENVLKEVKAFVTELAQRSLQESMRKAARGSKMLQFKGKPIPKKTYRFVTDHKM